MWGTCRRAQEHSHRPPSPEPRSENVRPIRIAQRIIKDCVLLFEVRDFSEYYNPITADPCGGAHFTRAVTMGIEILQHRDAIT